MPNAEKNFCDRKLIEIFIFLEFRIKEFQASTYSIPQKRFSKIIFINLFSKLVSGKRMINTKEMIN